MNHSSPGITRLKQINLLNHLPSHSQVPKILKSFKGYFRASRIHDHLSEVTRYIYIYTLVFFSVQMVDESKKEDAVKAIIYEATSRLRDPVYGSAGTIFHLQRMVEELKMQVESMRAQVVQLQEQRNQLLGILMNVRHLDSTSSVHDSKFDGGNFMLDEDSMAYDPMTFFTENDWTF